MPRTKHLSLEAPDNKVVIDFLGTESNEVKDRRACTVTLLIENGQLQVTVKGCDDRASILLDEVLELPEEDRRS